MGWSGVYLAPSTMAAIAEPVLAPFVNRWWRERLQTAKFVAPGSRRSELSLLHRLGLLDQASDASLALQGQHSQGSGGEDHVLMRWLGSA